MLFVFMTTNHMCKIAASIIL